MAAQVIARLTLRQLAAAWTAWLDFCSAQSRKQELLRGAVAHWMRRYLQAGLEAFAENVRRRRSTRAALAHFSLAAAAKAFVAWRQAGVQQRETVKRLMAIALRFQRPLLAEAWACWREATVEGQLRRQCLAAAVALWRNATLTGSFRTWRYQVFLREVKGVPALLC